jgi:UDP-N-acetylmuramyl pentapeptide phosphotransferase/UDP-N-acetylglucosamine-1-phosphate transferase
MKKLILKYGEILLAVYVFLGILGSIFLGFSFAQVSFVKTNNILQTILSFLVVFLISSGAVFLYSFVVYLLVDIRDKLKELIEKKQ